MDFALRPNSYIRFSRCYGSFNPCFSGFRIATHISRTINHATTCFNPCFSGFRIATVVSHRCPHLFNVVSILVLVDFALRPEIVTHPLKRRVVSILVLVDFALRLAFCPCLICSCIRFNPCFSGFRIATPLSTCEVSQYLSFNPCFSGFRIATIF